MTFQSFLLSKMLSNPLFFPYRKKTYEYPHCLKLSNSRVELISWTTTRNYLSHQQTTQLCQGSLLA